MGESLLILRSRSASEFSLAVPYKTIQGQLTWRTHSNCVIDLYENNEYIDFK